MPANIKYLRDAPTRLDGIEAFNENQQNLFDDVNELPATLNAAGVLMDEQLADIEDATLPAFYSENYQGDWNSGTTYALSDVVFYDNTFFTSKQAGNTNNIPVGNDADAWWHTISLANVNLGLAVNEMGSGSGTRNLDLSLYNAFELTMTGNTTLNLTNIPTGNSRFTVTVKGGADYALTMPDEVYISLNDDYGTNFFGDLKEAGSANLGGTYNLCFLDSGNKVASLDGSYNAEVHSLSTAYDVGSNTIIGGSGNLDNTYQRPAAMSVARSCFVPDDGSYFQVAFDSGNCALANYPMATPFDASTLYYQSIDYLTQDIPNYGSSFIRWAVSDDGLYLCIERTTTLIYQYTLSTAFDFSTAVFDTSLSISSFGNAILGLQYADNGNRFIVHYQRNSDSDHTARCYILGTAYDIGSQTGHTTVNTNINNVQVGSNIRISDDGLFYYIYRGGNYLKYTISSPFSSATVSFSATLAMNVAGGTNEYGIPLFYSSGTKCVFMTVNHSVMGVRLSLSTAYDLTTYTEDAGQELERLAAPYFSGISATLSSDGLTITYLSFRGADGYCFATQPLASAHDLTSAIIGSEKESGNFGSAGFVHTWNDDGTVLYGIYYAGGASPHNIYKYDVSIPFDIQEIDINGTIALASPFGSTVYGIGFNGDGTLFTVSSSTQVKVYELSTPYQIEGGSASLLATFDEPGSRGDYSRVMDTEVLTSNGGNVYRFPWFAEDMVLCFEKADGDNFVLNKLIPQALT